MPRFIGGRRALVGVLLLAGLAGCSSPSGSQAATTTTNVQAGRIAIWRQVIQCVRDNGMPNLPEPQFDDNGEPVFPGGDPPDPPPQAERACEPIWERLPPLPGEEPAEGRAPADIPALLRFAQCMRQQGLTDFPDPKPDGTFPLVGTSIEREGKSPRMLSAMRACRSLNPDPKGGIHGS